ncbi:glycoside hydrolase family 3 C-terminal domain-containing protein [Paenibacillus lautus]|uniref:beta-glucosidase n=1 Tax=Paenibacillus lautus TaxID=1401 RepID=UPI003D292030
MFNKQSTLTDQQIHEKANALLKEMSLKEKVWMLNGNWDPIENGVQYENQYNPIPIKTNGNERLGISPISFTDGPRGVVMGQSTCFPVSMARGASFDTELERRIGNVFGIESRAGGANYFAGVCINVLMHPAWGRAQETYGEDPFLLGEMGKALTEGVQDHNVMACVKHYAVNNIENTRFHVDVNLSERTLREVYLPHFKKCVDAGAASLMGSYNKFRGDHACESKYLLTTILRDEWGFEGFTSSDFIFGIRDGKKAIEAGMDVEMPMPVQYNESLLKLLESGEVDETYIDQAALRVIRTIIAFESTPDKLTYSKEKIACKSHTELAREAAEKSMVLIKNEGQVLPFNKKEMKKILLVGRLAVKENLGDHGSSRINPIYSVSPLQGIQSYFKDEVEVIHCHENELEKAKALASDVDAVVIVVGNDYNDEGEYVMPDSTNAVDFITKGYEQQGMSEKSAAFKEMMKQTPTTSYTSNETFAPGGDRKNLSLRQEEIQVINEMGSINKNTVVSLVCGSMIMTKEWEANVPAILYSWYAGMEGGNALARILFGDINPSGKLPFVIPTDESHLHPFDSSSHQAYYDFYHGYRKLDKENHTPAYPFGFGLSYTNYSYSDLNVEKEGDSVIVKVKVRNAGNVAGEEVVQVYVSVPNSKVERHIKVLKGFTRVHLIPGENKEVVVPITLKELEYYNEDEESWVLEDSNYVFLVGPSSDEKALLRENIKLSISET